ncbi:MAG: glutamine amidotransferase family protein [candidate division WOR-3 bacterium]|nr:glutamine amidotransferase family protein [Candidatus Omnitrophota bacterium]MCM8807881.1 glutamine amidotransferase family protein [Candidatus Omnitrophota bacterium]
MDERFFRVPSGCGVCGIMSKNGQLFSGEKIVKSMCNMIERGNGLGSGFAGYGIYPEFHDNWCFHVMYNSKKNIEIVEKYLKESFDIIHSEPIPTKNGKKFKFVPILHRYFLKIKQEKFNNKMDDFSEDDLIVNAVMFINRNIEDAFIFSSGKNMGIFKGVGNPDEIGDFYKIYEYKGYLWTAHNRFPTNTVAWWGGAHPFGILDWAVVHNGEISSYGINRRYLENFGYYCTLFTDTEVITYLFDLLHRKHKIDFETIGKILASPFWFQIDRIKDENYKNYLKMLRIIYGPALINGPFAIIVTNSEYMIGLNDRIKLRPLVAGEDENFYYLSSEEAAIRIINNNLKVYQVDAGKPFIFKVKWQS